MTQPSASESSAQDAMIVAKSSRKIATASDNNKAQQLSQAPAIRHPNFDPTKTPINPARPLTDIPDPAPNYNGQLRRLYKGTKSQRKSAKSQHSQTFMRAEATLSKWALIESEALAEHLALLTAAGLIELPASFYTNYSEQPLLPSLSQLTLLDMVDIHAALKAYPDLTRYGIASRTNSYSELTPAAQHTEHRYNYDADELLNSIYADDWEVLLYPERFDSGEGSLVSDILPCSVAVHALRTCETRKTINCRYSAKDICHYLRSYLLSQLSLLPQHRQQYRQIRLFAGHVIVAAHYLGWEIQLDADGMCYFNVSSRCGLLSRYPNVSDYYVNGWLG